MSQELLWANWNPVVGGDGEGGRWRRECALALVVTALDREGKPGHLLSLSIFLPKLHLTLRRWEHIQGLPRPLG